MRIAVPTNDGVTLSAHFGRSAAFLVFEVEDGKARQLELRPNRPCGHEEGHNHGGMAAVLEGCEVVLFGGMGQGAATALRQAGITPVSVPAAGPAADLVAAYVAGTLKPSAGGLCQCGHGEKTE